MGIVLRMQKGHDTHNKEGIMLLIKILFEASLRLFIPVLAVVLTAGYAAAGADLGVDIQAETQGVVEEPIAIDVIVSNQGPMDAMFATLGIGFSGMPVTITAITPENVCESDTDFAFCFIDLLPFSATFATTIVLMPHATGDLTTGASVGSATSDPNPLDNVRVEVIPIVPPSSPPTECDGEEATIIGTDDNDRLIGTRGDDVILGLKGDDFIDGRGGDDLICAGPGNDTVFGADGDDTIFGDQGDDFLFGERQFLTPEKGDDLVFGGPGADRMTGGPGDDHLFGEQGDDAMFGNGGDDRLFGGTEDDGMVGGTGDDECHGGPGNDIAAFNDCETISSVP